MKPGNGRVRSEGEGAWLGYSPQAADRLWTAFRGLFTRDMTVMLELEDGSERRRDVLSRVDDHGWRSEGFVWEFDQPGAIVGLKIINDRGEVVAGATYSPPCTYGRRQEEFDLAPPTPPFSVGFDPLRLQFGVDLQGGPRERHAAAA